MTFQDSRRSRSTWQVTPPRIRVRVLHVIARSQRVRPEVAAPMTGSATKPIQCRAADIFADDARYTELDCFASLAMTKRDHNEQKGSGTPTSAFVQPPHHRMRRASSGTRSPVGVPPRLLPSGLSPLGRDSRPGFLGRGGSASSYQARPNRGAKDSAPLNRRYPRPPVPVQGMHLPDRS
jgi:hypothetical protein